MGSVPSTPNREGSDPWWPIENQNLELNPIAIGEQQQQDIQVNEIQSSNSEMSSSDKIENTTNVDVAMSNDETNSESDGVATTSNSKFNENDESNSEKKQNLNHQQSLEEFKEALRAKRELRKCAIAELRNEMTSLRCQLAEEKKLNEQLNREKRACKCQSEIPELTVDSIATESDNDVKSIESNIDLRSQLANVQFDLQKANAENFILSSELTATKRKAQSLKDIIAASKEIIEIRETELLQVIVDLLYNLNKQIIHLKLVSFRNLNLFNYSLAKIEIQGN